MSYKKKRSSSSNKREPYSDFALVGSKLVVPRHHQSDEHKFNKWKATDRSDAAHSKANGRVTPLDTRHPPVSQRSASFAASSRKPNRAADSSNILSHRGSSQLWSEDKKGEDASIKENNINEDWNYFHQSDILQPNEHDEAARRIQRWFRKLKLDQSLMLTSVLDRQKGRFTKTVVDSTESPRRKKRGRERPIGQEVEDLFGDEASRSEHDLQQENPAESFLEKIRSSHNNSPLLNGNSNNEERDEFRESIITIDKLMKNLEKLEEEESLHSKFSDKQPDNASSEVLSKVTSANLDRLAKENEKIQSKHKSSKYRNIISYLDAVENPVELHEEVPPPTNLSELREVSVKASEVTNKVLSQQIELQQKQRSVETLQKALEQQRELTVMHVKEAETEMNNRLKMQKEEYEEAIKRHLSFIDQLIDDKKALGEKCSGLLRELKTSDKKYTETIKQMKENHSTEMKKIKELNSATEKLRRERWIDEQTKKIKNMTVKGLEPEIQRLIAKHKSEVKRLKSVHEAELLAADERAASKYVHMTEQLRTQLAEEMENACTRERQIAKNLYEKQMEQEQEAYDQQKTQLVEQASRQRTELNAFQAQLEENAKKAAQLLQEQFQRSQHDQTSNHQREMLQLKEQIEIEKESWMENQLKKQETWMLTKEREIKERLKKERDREIDLVIDRLEKESTTSVNEAERVLDNRLKRVRDKYESELAELEYSEKSMSKKYNSCKTELTELVGEHERLKVLMTQRDREVMDLKGLLTKLNNERSEMADIVRQEFADRIASTEQDNKRIKKEMMEQRAQHRAQIDGVKEDMEKADQNREKEMKKVHERVKQAMTKKEDILAELRQQYNAAQKRAEHLEGLLEEQRKMLKKL